MTGAPADIKIVSNKKYQKLIRTLGPMVQYCQITGGGLSIEALNYQGQMILCASKVAEHLGQLWDKITTITKALNE